MEKLVSVEKARVPFSTSWKHGSPSLLVEQFEVSSNETVFVVGKSGQGKTTLLRAILSLHPITEGVINISQKATKRGLMAQQPQLIPWRSVRGNLELPSEINQALERPSDISQRLERLGIGGCEEKLPHELSVGMRARVTFLQVLYSMPTLICLDEPSASLDDRSTALLMQELSNYLAATGSAAIISSHDRELVKNWTVRTYGVVGDGIQNHLEMIL